MCHVTRKYNKKMRGLKKGKWLPKLRLYTDSSWNIHKALTMCPDLHSYKRSSSRCRVLYSSHCIKKTQRVISFLEVTLPVSGKAKIGKALKSLVLTRLPDLFWVWGIGVSLGLHTWESCGWQHSLLHFPWTLDMANGLLKNPC